MFPKKDNLFVFTLNQMTMQMYKWVVTAELQ